MAIKTANLMVQKWGNSLAVRIPAAIARSVHFQLGSVVELAVQDGGVFVKSIGERTPSLDERLKSFDPQKHGGEVMVSSRVGEEF